MNEDKTQKQINLGARADALLRDEAFSTSCQRLKDDLISSWQTTKPHETATRESIWHELRAVDRMRDRLTTMHSDGRLAQRDIENANKRKAA